MGTTLVGKAEVMALAQTERGRERTQRNQLLVVHSGKHTQPSIGC